ncbi:hypothetical protein HII31_12883 [Pseudocercospora fuligena]|uniref:Uncharacterized protein n=1 Tax=Pseudocercospora fuligena TaxID=685502 RepID=A0A8H6R963_9PEZI|nr:hypothetical protein HII31_12883 [Pseudocercospora fuligena]
MSSTIISTTLTALGTPGVQRLLALVCGFTLVKILTKPQIDSKASISFSSWLACTTMTLALGIHPELGHIPATLFMLIAGAILGSTGLISDFEDNNQSETEDQQYIKFIEAYNEYLDLLLDETASSQRIELEAKDQEISYLESQLSLDKQHISALTQISHIDGAEIETLRSEIQELRNREEALEIQNEELRARLNEANQEHFPEISRLQLELSNQDQYISELEEYYESLQFLDESHIAALKQGSQDDENREESFHTQLKDSGRLIASKQSLIQKFFKNAEDARSLKQERDAWKREAEILDKEIEEIYEYTGREEGVVGLYYRCKEAKMELNLAGDEIKRLRSQRNEARDTLKGLENKFLDLKGVFESEFVAQSKELAEKCEEVERWEERWNEQAELNAESIEILMEKAAEIEGLEEKIVKLREEVEDQQRVRSELENPGQRWEEVGSSGSEAESESDSSSEVIVKLAEEKWSDDEIYGICLGYDW